LLLESDNFLLGTRELTLHAWRRLGALGLELRKIRLLFLLFRGETTVRNSQFSEFALKSSDCTAVPKDRKMLT
jgi:hypothetical protein